jgi:hypothetical protein
VIFSFAYSQELLSPAISMIPVRTIVEFVAAFPSEREAEDAPAKQLHIITGALGAYDRTRPVEA